MRFIIFPLTHGLMSIWFSGSNNSENYVVNSFSEWILALAIKGVDFYSMPSNAINCICKQLERIWQQYQNTVIVGILTKHDVKFEWYRSATADETSVWKFYF